MTIAFVGTVEKRTSSIAAQISVEQKTSGFYKDDRTGDRVDVQIRKTVLLRLLSKVSIVGTNTRSFNLKVSAGAKAERKYGEHSLKINKVKKMKMTPGN